MEREGRPTVEMTFDGSGRLDRMRTQVVDPASGHQVTEEITLEGAISAGGVQWPLRLFITQDGAPFFDLELSALAIGTSEELTREARRK